MRKRHVLRVDEHLGNVLHRDKGGEYTGLLSCHNMKKPVDSLAREIPVLTVVCQGSPLWLARVQAF